jgi:hypothetical protein
LGRRKQRIRREFSPPGRTSPETRDKIKQEHKHATYGAKSTRAGDCILEYQLRIDSISFSYCWRAFETEFNQEIARELWGGGIGARESLEKLVEKKKGGKK